MPRFTVHVRRGIGRTADERQSFPVVADNADAAVRAAISHMVAPSPRFGGEYLINVVRLAETEAELPAVLYSNGMGFEVVPEPTAPFERLVLRVCHPSLRDAKFLLTATLDRNDAEALTHALSTWLSESRP